MSVHKIWESIKYTPEFADALDKACEEKQIGPSDTEVITFYFNEDPVMVEVIGLDDGSKLAEVRPYFFGQTLSSLDPAVIKLGSNKPKP